MRGTSWRSIDESPLRVRRKLVAKVLPPKVDPVIRGLELTAIWLFSVIGHLLLGMLLVVLYFDIPVEPEQAYSVTIWRDAKGKDSLRIGAPEEGPPKKGAETAPEIPAPKVEPPPLPPAPPQEEQAFVREIPVPVPPVPAPAPVLPEGGRIEPAPAIAAPIGAGASSPAPAADTAGAPLPSTAGKTEVSDADIERDPTAAIRRRRSGELTRVREGSQRDIVVVSGAYDLVQDVLARLEIPCNIIDPEQLAKADLSRCKILLVNCHNTYSQQDFRPFNTGTVEKELVAAMDREAALRKAINSTKDKRRVFELGLELLQVSSEVGRLKVKLSSATDTAGMTENVRKFVERGGYLFTTDWGLSLLERAFPGNVKNGGLIGPRTVTLRPRSGQTKNPLLEEVFYQGPKTGTVVSRKLIWEIDSGSYQVTIQKSSVEVLAEAGDMQKSPAVALAFTPEKAEGKVLHIISHFQRQATKQGDYALQNLLLNFLLERVRKGT